ncbi:MAG: beta strand repeat-containing protein, partial [Candidatus Rifleibacteriota bacterium]
KRDSQGKWYFEVQAYYNPQTRQIILEDVDPKGGRVYLTGRIASTGNGKILAFDGSSDINLVNQTSRPVTVGKINLGNETGLISITDLEKNTITEFKRDSTTTRTIGSTVSTVSGASSVYNPKSGQYYNWSTGKEVAATEDYYKKIDFRLWGGYTKNETTITELESTETLLSSSSGEQNKLPGTYIGTLSKPGTTEYVINYDNNVDYFSSYFDKWITYRNAIKSRGSEHYKWGSSVGKILTFQHSLKADHGIQIGFIGSTTGGKVSISSTGNVNLTGDLSGHAGTNLTVNSTGGSIQQTGGRLIGDHLNLTAKTGIGSDGTLKHHILSDKGSLSAVTTSGNIDIVSTTATGKKGDVEIGKLTTGGDIKFTADGSIYRSSASDTLVKGRRIDLLSNKGQIGKSGAALKIEAGQTPAASGDTMSASINAKARDSIFLEQTSGNMRLGRIESELGDVELNVVNGSFDNVLPIIDNANDRKGDELVEKWVAMGLVNADGTDNGAAFKTRAISDYENMVKSEFASYSAQKAYYSANPGVTKPASYNALAAKYSSYSTATAYLTAKKSDSSSDYYKISNNTYGWTRDNLLYALQKSIMNPTSGSSGSLSRPANIKGKNITLKAANGGIGRDGTPEELSTANLSTNLEVLKKLAGAEASDITWKEAEAKAIINNTTAIGIEMTSSSGGLTAIGKNNIYIAAATEDPIYLKNIDAGSNNIRLLGKDGIFNVTTITDSVNLKGKDLIIEGGAIGTSSSIGKTDKAIVTDLTGKLTARAEGYINIFQNSLNSLVISALYGGGDVKLRSKKNMGSVNTGVAFDDSGYLNAMGKLTLVSDAGNIGEDDKGIRILTDDLDSIDVTATNIYLKGQTNSSSKPALKIAKAKTGSGGTMQVVSDAAAVDFDGKIEAGTLEVNTTTVSQNESTGSIIAGTLNAVTTSGLNLDSLNNMISNAAMSNLTGSILLKNKTALKLLGVTNSSTGTTDKLVINNSGTLTFGGVVDAKNIELNATLIAQDNVSSIKTDSLNVVSNDGLNLQSVNNQVKKATLTNSISGDIILGNKESLTLLAVTNSSTAANSKFALNSTAAVDFTGAVNAKNVSVKALSVSQNETSSSIVTDRLETGTEKGLALDSSSNQIKRILMTNKTSGNIIVVNSVVLDLDLAENLSTTATDMTVFDNGRLVRINGILKGPKVVVSSTTLNQGKDGSIQTPDLEITTKYGLSINSGKNKFSQATLKNRVSGDINLKNGMALKLLSVENLSTDANSGFFIENAGDLTFAGAVNAKNVVIKANSVAQDEANSSIVTSSLEGITQNGLSLDSANNVINKVNLTNSLSGDIVVANKGVLEIAKAENLSTTATDKIDIVNARSVVLSGLLKGPKIKLFGTSLTEGTAGALVTADLDLTTKYGLSLNSNNNEISKAVLLNSNSGNMVIKNKTAMDLIATNKSTAATAKISVDNSLNLRLRGEGKNFEVNALTLVGGIKTDNLVAVTQNGMTLRDGNQIKQASLTNTTSGAIELESIESALKLLKFVNSSTSEKERNLILAVGIDLIFAGQVDARNLEVMAKTISQDETASSIKTNDLRIESEEGLSLDSLTNQISQIQIRNRRGDSVFKNNTSLIVNDFRGGDNVAMSNIGDMTFNRGLAGRNVTVNLIGSINSNDRFNAVENLTVNATGKITLRSARARNVYLNSGLAQSAISLNVLDEASRNLRINLFDDQTDERNLYGNIVNNIADSGGINVYELIADEEIHGRSAAGDILVADIEGKKIVLEGSQNGRINLDRARLGEVLKVSGGEFDGGQIEHTGSTDNLKLEFAGANGGYMKDVTVNKVISATGVQIDNLNSMTADINAECDLFTIKDADLMVYGVFSNGQTSVTVPGSENFSSEIKFSGPTVSVTKHEAIKSTQSSTEKIAGIVNSTNESMNGDAGQELSEKSDKSKNMIEFTGLKTSRINSEMLASHDGKVFLTAENDEDEEVSEEKNAEKENQD